MMIRGPFDQSLLLAHVPGGQEQLPHFPVSSAAVTVSISLLSLAQVPGGHEQFPHFPVSPATVKLLMSEAPSENEFSQLQAALHPHLAQQSQLPQDMMQLVTMMTLRPKARERLDEAKAAGAREDQAKSCN
jgi:hypothetical protein